MAEKPKRNYNWLYIAASFFGFLLIATVFLSQTETAIDAGRTKVVLETEKSSKIKNQITTPKKVQIIFNTASKNEEVLVQFNKETIQNQTNKPINQTSEVAIINQKTQQVNQNPIAQHPSPITNYQSPSYVNVDALLASVEQADSTPKKEQFFNQKSDVNVNASSLLSQVDGELELSFREKVIQKVSKNYRTVKVALSNRNNQ